MDPHIYSPTALYDQVGKQFQEELLTMIIDQVRNDEVISVLRKADDLNMRDNVGNTLLHIAAQYDNMVVTQHLIESGCEINVQNSSGKTPLIAAIENTCQHSTNVLLDANANIFIYDNEGYSALDWLLYLGCFQTSQFFEEFLKKVESQCFNDTEVIANKLCDAGCMLPWVVSLRNVEVIEKMLRHGCKVNEREPITGHTALHKAILLHDVKLVNLFLGYYAYTKDKFDFSLVDNVPQNKSFTSDASADDRAEIVNMSIDGAAALETPSEIEYLCSEVLEVLRNENKETIQILVQADLDLTKTDENLNTAVHILAKNRNPGVFDALENQNFDVNARNISLKTPLFIAAAYGNAYAVEFLLKRGAEVNAVNDDHHSPLYACIEQISYALESQYIKCVQLLLEYDADVQLYGFTIGNQLSVFHIVPRKHTYSIGESLIAQLVLKEALGTSICDRVRNQIHSHSSFNDYYNFSKQQLSTKFGESLTLLDLLRESDDKFECHVRNQQVASNVLQFGNESETKSGYLNAVLQKKYSKAVQMLELRKEAAIFICKLMMTDYCRFPLIADQIVDYLNEADIRNLLFSV